MIGRQINYNEGEEKEIIILSGGSTYYPTPVIGRQINYNEGEEKEIIILSGGSTYYLTEW